VAERNGQNWREAVAESLTPTTTFATAATISPCCHIIDGA
jgi:hypothetical protein